MRRKLVEVYGDNSHLLIKTKLAQQISLAVKGCYLTDVLGDGVRLCMPWDLETTQQVASWHVPTLSPMLRDYDFIGRFEPYLHQLKICSFLSANKRGFCLADMGTGKTASVVWTIDYLYKLNKIKRVLIVGALSNMKSTWKDEFFAINPLYEVTVLHGEKEQRLTLAQNNAHVHIINHDGVETILPQLLKNNYDVVVVDELTAFKNDKADRWKAMFPLCQRAEYVWGLTGTPMPNRPDEVYGQIKLIKPGNVQGISAGRFKEMVMRKMSQFTWKPRFDAHDIVARYMAPAIKIEKSEVLALPKVHHEYVEVPLTLQQAEFYKKMAQDQLVRDVNATITAVNGGALMQKLLQVATGAIYNDAHEAMAFDVTPRIEKTIELIRQARARSTIEGKGKTLVFAPFRHTVALLKEELSKHFEVAVITGETTAKERADIFAEFQHENTPDVILAVPRAMSHGVTATSASCIIWFGPVTSNETYQQACNRIDRPGQTQEMYIYHLHSTPVEKKLYETLKNRKVSQADLLNLYTDFIRGL